MKIKRKPLTGEQFKALTRIQGWKMFDIPREQWKSIIGLSRHDDTIAVMGSADVHDPILLNMVNAVAGFDQLVHEPRPHDGEPAGNAYHYVIEKTSNANYPFVISGPYNAGMNLPHWFNEDDLDSYLDNDAKESSS